MDDRTSPDYGVDDAYEALDGEETLADEATTEEEAAKNPEPLATVEAANTPPRLGPRDIAEQANESRSRGD